MGIAKDGGGNEYHQDFKADTNQVRNILMLCYGSGIQSGITELRKSAAHQIKRPKEVESPSTYHHRNKPIAAGADTEIP
jgi:hypothetical protein